MKAILIILTCAVSLWSCNTKAEQQGKESRDIASLEINTTYFKTQAQSILQKNCSPCHFPGGKQYTKLPFDNCETIIHHEAGVFKRIKDEKDLSLIRQFIWPNKRTN